MDQSTESDTPADHLGMFIRNYKFSTVEHVLWERFRQGSPFSEQDLRMLETELEANHPKLHKNPFASILNVFSGSYASLQMTIWTIINGEEFLISLAASKIGEGDYAGARKICHWYSRHNEGVVHYIPEKHLNRLRDVFLEQKEPKISLLNPFSFSHSLNYHDLRMFLRIELCD